LVDVLLDFGWVENWIFRQPMSERYDVMTGHGRMLKILEQCELEFPMTADAAMLDVVGRPSGQNNEQERSRGAGSWDSVRPSKVKRARALLQDPDYPSKSTLDAVAGLMARHFGAKPRK
jgi:hypothetical protein